MITPPRRSVTRFLIPFIDVLILLFAIFLLLPFVSDPSENADDLSATTGDAEVDQIEMATLKAELANTRRQLEELRRQRANPAEKLQVRVLEIDHADGRLYTFDTDQGRVELRNQGDALRLIQREKTLAGGKDLYFLILYPRQLSGYPLREQVETYRRWFQDVPHGFDNPRLTLETGS